MKKSAIQIIILAAALLIVCIVCRLAMNNTYMAEIHIPMNRGVTGGDEISVSTDRPGIVEYGAPSMKNGRMRVPIRPGMAGETFMDIRDTNGDELALFHFHVDRFGTVYDKATGGFTGDSIVLAAFTVFCLAVSAIMFSAYHRAKGPAFYSYGTIYAAGFSLFALLTGLLMLMVTVRHISKPFDYSMPGNTFQNMENAKRIIEKDHPDARVVYATTNYHVFRSGVWASLAGLPAEGMGSRTKWWYWPNAFMRECAGLFLNRIWQELALLLIMIAFFGALSMVLG